VKRRTLFTSATALAVVAVAGPLLPKPAYATGGVLTWEMLVEAERRLHDWDGCYMVKGAL